MKVDIYKALTNPDPGHRLFLFVPADTDLALLPENLRQQLGELIHHKSVEFEAGDKRLGMDTTLTIKNLEEEGFHLQTIDVRLRKSA